MTKWLLLGANNVNTDIEVTPYDTYDEAKSDMDAAVEAIKGETGADEAEVETFAASVHTGGDLYYWNITEIEV